MEMPQKKKCLPKDFPDAGETYARTQGGNNPTAAKEQFLLNCNSFSYSNMTTNEDVYVFNDFLFIPNEVTKKAALLILDVNAHKGPNKWGHDMFVFELKKRKRYDSVFVLEPSQRCHPLDIGGYYTTHFFNYLYGQNTNY